MDRESDSGFRRTPLNPRPDPGQQEMRRSGLLFVITCMSVFLVYLFRWQPSPLDGFGPAGQALMFTTALMSILLGHELAHYVVARVHQFRLSLPLFLPAPVWVGTLGAIIRLEDTPRHRAGLLEMGVAGPLAGFFIVTVTMFVRLCWCADIPYQDSIITFQSPVLWRSLCWLLKGVQIPIHPGDPLAFAAWIGCLLTAMNLLPIGQLDGGHVVAAAFPALAEHIGRGTTAVLVLAGFAWIGWPVWAVLLYLLGAAKPCVVRRPESTLSRRSRGLAFLGVLVFALCLTPVPMS